MSTGIQIDVGNMRSVGEARLAVPSVIVEEWVGGTRSNHERMNDGAHRAQGKKTKRLAY